MINVLKRRKELKIDRLAHQSLTIEKKHPLAIRWFHWINFPVMTIMVWSGIIIYWAVTKDTGNPMDHGPYTITLFGHEFFRFFPDGFYGFGSVDKATQMHSVYDLSGRLAEGMSWHFLFMWIFAINGLIYVLFTAMSGEWRYILPNRRSFKDSIHVVLYDLHLTKKPPPKSKYNGAQKIAYTGVIIMGLGSLVTGIAIYKPVQASLFTRLVGGYEFARWLHFWLMILFVLFFAVHVAQVVRAGWNNFRSMITGCEIVSEEGT